MKKTVCVFLTFVMLCTTILGLVGVSATESTIDEALLLHWDFEGPDLATQLANKATAGDATDSISFNTDGVSSWIENGECTIGDKSTEWLSFIVDNNNKGAKLVEKVTDSYTVYLRFKMDKLPSTTTTIMALNHKANKAMRERLYMTNTGNLKVRPNNTSGSDFFLQALAADQYISVAIVVQKNNDGTFNNKAYFTIDDWNNTKSASKNNLTSSASVMANGFDMLFGSRMWNQTTGGDQSSTNMGVNYTFDDIRFYSRALTEAEVKTIPHQMRITDFNEKNTPTYRGCQVSAVSNSAFNMRFVGTVDSLQYKEVGFVIQVTDYNSVGGDEKVFSTDTVYTAITGSNDVGGNMTYTAENLGGNYIFALSVLQIPIDYAVTFSVSPYYIAIGGAERVRTATYLVTVQNGRVVSQTVSN